jgi:hypothetical protein
LGSVDLEDLPVPFCFELRHRVYVKAGKKWAKKKHSGAAVWLAKRINVTTMSACRYLEGQSIPLPRIAKKISVVLNWCYSDLVKSIVVVEVENIRQKTIKKYR